MGGGYKSPPWPFKGRALYQLQLVKSKEARKYIPADLNMVDFFGYTLGGLYLARYDDSPVGTFDEAVVLAGLVWNPPTSCAWAGRVYVNNREARDHGIKECGLPSHFVGFSQMDAPKGSARRKQAQKKGCWWAEGRKGNVPGGTVALTAADSVLSTASMICEMDLPGVPPPGQWRGPKIRMALPSFSGLTAVRPQLLKYDIDMNAQVRLSAPIKLRAPPEAEEKKRRRDAQAVPSAAAFDVARLFVGPPLLTIAFDNLQMMAGAPKVVVPTPVSTPVPGVAGGLNWKSS